MYDNIGPGAAAPNTNVGGFANGYYWSSSEGNANDAWDQFFVDGLQNVVSKGDADRVRAVRAF